MTDEAFNVLHPKSTLTELDHLVDFIVAEPDESYSP